MQFTAKQEMLARLGRIAEGLRERGHGEPAEALDAVCRSLKATVPRHATIQEVIVRTLATVIREGVTLEGRLVDALGHLAVVYSVPMSMHPVLMLVTALGSRHNPDRDTEQGNGTLDAILGSMLEMTTDYQSALYAIATFARNHGLDATADQAVELLHELAPQGQAAQAEKLQEILVRKPDLDPTDDFSWVIKLLLTLATITALSAVAGHLAGPLRDLLDYLSQEEA